MPKLPDKTRVTTAAGAVWKTCVGCGLEFPAAPDQVRCPGCDLAPVLDSAPAAASARCAAAHSDDRSPCEGPGDAVQIVDRTDAQVAGCVRHGAVLLASTASARVYPGSVPGAAIEAHRRAATLRPFQFTTTPPGGWS
jgi:hypothetical protein